MLCVRLGFFAGAVAASMVGVLEASAAEVALNASGNGYTFSGDIIDARYRLSNTNWDHAISTSSNVTPATLASTANIGNNSQLNNVTWDFALSFSPSNGWTYTLTNGPTSHVRTWSAPYNGVSPIRSFHALEIFVVATNPNATIYQSVSARATNMSFVSAQATTTGSLVDLVSVSNGLVRQYVISDTDLSTIAWSLQGKVNLAYVLNPGQNAGNLDERVKFDIKGETAVPAPASLALLGAVGLGAGRRRR